MDSILLSIWLSFSKMAETNWVNLQFDRHIQRQKNKVYGGKHKNTRRELPEAFETSCNDYS